MIFGRFVNGYIAVSNNLAGCAVLFLKKCVLNFVMDTQQPFLRAAGTIAEMGGFRFKLSRPFFRGSKLRRNLMRQIHGSDTLNFCLLGCLLQQCNDTTSGVICHDIGVRMSL